MDPKDMQMSKKGAEELAKYEQFKAYPYDDHNPNKKLEKYNKNATIGYGHLIDDEKEFEKYKNGITKAEAIKLKQKDIKDHEQVVKKHITIPLTQNQYDALVMRAYNTGEGGFINKKTRSKEMTDYINSGKDLTSHEFAKIYQARCYSKKGYMKGIENRRIKELDYMNTGKVNEAESYLATRRMYGPKKK